MQVWTRHVELRLGAGRHARPRHGPLPLPLRSVPPAHDDSEYHEETFSPDAGMRRSPDSSTLPGRIRGPLWPRRILGVASHSASFSLAPLDCDPSGCHVTEGPSTASAPTRKPPVVSIASSFNLRLRAPFLGFLRGSIPRGGVTNYSTDF